MEIVINETYKVSTSLALLILILLIIVLMLLRKIPYLSKKKESDSSKDINDWVEKKDLFYWIIIICLGAISLFTYDYSGNKDAISHWGFAGTIVSIILAVVALIFTFYQTFSNNNSATIIEDAAKKIKKATDGFDTNEIIKAGTIISDISENLQQQIRQLNQEMVSIRADQTTSFKNIQKLFEQQLQQNNNKNEVGIYIELEPGEFINKIYFELPGILQFMIYSIYSFNKEKINLTRNMEENFLSGVCNITITSESSEFIQGYAKGLYFSALINSIIWLEFFGLRKTDNGPILPPVIINDLDNLDIQKDSDIDDLDLAFLKKFIEENK
ncbi:hypothetical protein [Niallia sp. Man26]|uniref:hypothetical protein n=1 Tax=Niallia sp. Man26 TaxID=2912824 RepID=UPI001EDA1A05|nr:hypothetical protein [Niallia sp. Man26]UPO88321.1 hypothetical protein L8T27_003905 [Niallia sp. Man26]